MVNIIYILYIDTWHKLKPNIIVDYASDYVRIILRQSAIVVSGTPTHKIFLQEPKRNIQSQIW